MWPVSVFAHVEIIDTLWQLHEIKFVASGMVQTFSSFWNLNLLHLITDLLRAHSIEPLDLEILKIICLTYVSFCF